MYNFFCVGNNDLKQEYLDMRQELTTAAPLQSSTPATNTSSGTSSESKPKSKAVPKWLQKGLFNKK